MFAKFTFYPKMIEQFMSFEYFFAVKDRSGKIPANIGTRFRKIFVMSAKILSKLRQSFACCIQLHLWLYTNLSVIVTVPLTSCYQNTIFID